MPPVALEVDLPPTLHDPDAVAELADRVMARPEFGRGGNVLQQLQDWVVERITDALASLSSAEGASALGWAVLAVVLVGAMVLIARFGRGTRRDPGVTLGGRDPAGGTAEEWRREAARRASAGDSRGALRAHHRALLAELDDRALVELVPGRTAGEYRADIAMAAPAAAGPVTEATALFERGVYGPGHPPPADVDRFAVLADEIVAGTRR